MGRHAGKVGLPAAAVFYYFAEKLATPAACVGLSDVHMSDRVLIAAVWTSLFIVT